MSLRNVFDIKLRSFCVKIVKYEKEQLEKRCNFTWTVSRSADNGPTSC